MPAPTFLACARVACDLLQSPRTAAAWNHESVLPSYTVGGLAGHLGRAVLTIEGYLDQEATTGQAIGPEAYFARVLEGHDPVDSEFHRGVRSRAEQTAAAGAATLAAEVGRASAVLEQALRANDLSAHRIRVLADTCMTVDDYLRTRIVELVVHIDDLATSLDVPVPQLPDEAYRICTGVLAQVAVTIRGGRDAVRLLARPARTNTSFGAL